MKKAIISCGLLCVLAMLAFAAQAADIVCVERNALGFDSAYHIMKATLDNGQVIYYAAMEDNGAHVMADVNFDGYEDFVPTVVLGARNYCSVFYLYNPQTGLYEPLYTIDQGFWNYSLNDEKKYIISEEQDGYLYRDIKIYAWQENMLTLLRCATVEGLRTVEFDDAGMTEYRDFSRYEMTVRDFTNDPERGEIIYQQVYPEDDPQYEDHRVLLNTVLWDGL